MEVAIDYRERAPAGVAPEHFESLPAHASRFSGHAVAVPGTVAGLLHALERYGTLGREKVMAPAIRLARDGWDADAHFRDAAAELATTLDERPDLPAESTAFLRRTYFESDGRTPRARITNPEQASALELIAKQGVGAFTRGAIGAAIVRTTASAGGVLTGDDLASFAPKEVAPLEGSFRGRRLLTMPLPSSGGVTLLQVLALVDLMGERPASMSPVSAEWFFALAECFKHAFADRAAFLADPEFAPDPTWRLLAPARLARKGETLNTLRTRPADFYAGPLTGAPGDAGTSHVSVVDRSGNAAACTETVNLSFGSRIAVAEFGFVLNNEMDDFLTRRGEPNAFGLTQAEANLPAPGKRPLSSMTPTIVLDKGGRVEGVVGGSGGPRIITAVAQVLLNWLVFGMGAREAVASPRIHHQWMPETLQMEDLGGDRSAGVRFALEGRGHRVVPFVDEGVVQFVVRTGQGWEAASDPRKGGLPAGE
ncbi:MAG TPA: gamma-glutamyltransferase [Phycisphaerales bacterium]|nr:gamma-glutamyltransferase [Phycisphaerales bacterium]